MKDNFGNIFPLDEVDATIAGGVVSRKFCAAQHFQRSAVNMIEKTAQSLIMFFLLTATAFHIGIEKVVVADINLVSAGATAMPEHRAFCSASIGWIQRRQSTKFLPGNIRDRLFFTVLQPQWVFRPMTSKVPRISQAFPQLHWHFHQTPLFAVAFFGFPNYRKISEVFPCKIMSNRLCGTFFAKAAAAQ